MIDPKKPIRFTHKHERHITLVGVMPNGNLVVTSAYSNGEPWNEPVLFDKDDGKALTTKEGSGLVIENAPVIDSAFWPVHTGSGEPYGRGMTMLAGVWMDYLSAHHAIEIIRTDGVPTEAKIHARP